MLQFFELQGAFDLGPLGLHVQPFQIRPGLKNSPSGDVSIPLAQKNPKKMCASQPGIAWTGIVWYSMVWTGIVGYSMVFGTIHLSFVHLCPSLSHPCICGRIDGVVTTEVHGIEQQRLRTARPTELGLGSRLNKRVASGSFVFQIW